MTSVLIVFEMTGGYGLVLPLMIANMSAFALARRWRQVPIYEALLAQDGIHLPHGSKPSDPPGSLPVPAQNLPLGQTEDATA
jgi:CIC family chloride channel protein